jgi:hypothetical protein
LEEKTYTSDAEGLREAAAEFAEHATTIFNAIAYWQLFKAHDLTSRKNSTAYDI